MKRLFILLSVITIFQLLHAQQKSITDTIFSLSEVEVIASRKKKIDFMGIDAPLKYLPVTVSKLDEITLERKNIVNMEDAVRFLPGVTVTDQLGAFQRYSIRGTSDAVVMVNGIRDERSLLNNVPFDDLSSVESIEVIKGPASILGGHSLMGGIINIVRKKLSNRTTASAKLSYGSWNNKQSSIGFGGRLYGPVNYRAHIYYSNGEGYRHVGADRFSGMLALGAQIGHTGYVEGHVSFNNDKYRTEIGSAPTMPGDIYEAATGKLVASKSALNPLADYRTVYNDIANNKMRVRNIDFSLRYTQELAEWIKLREQFGYGHRDLDYSAVERMRYRTSKNPVYNWYYTDAKGAKTYIELDSLRSDTPLVFNPDSRSFTNTLEFTGKIPLGAVSNSYALGWAYSFFDYTQYNGYEDGDVWGPGVNQVLPLKNPHLVRNWWDSKVSAVSIRHYNTNGIYFHDVLDFGEKWKAMIGARYDLHRFKSTTATAKDGRQEYDKADRKEWSRINTSALTYRAGLVYFPVSRLSLYASAASYFKPITTTYNPNTIYLDRNGNRFDPDKDGGQVFRPEKGNQMELGLRYELDKKLEVNASLFYINKYNSVKTLGKLDEEENGSVVSKSVRAQVGRAVSKGFDMDITFRPASTLQIAAGWGWSDYRLRKVSINTDAWPDFNETANQRATGVPRTTFFAYADYTVPKGIFKDLSFHLSGTYTDRIYISIAENTYFPSLFLLDAGLYYSVGKHIRLSLLVNNLLNKEHFVKRTTLGKPRNFSTSITYTL